jgi:hypothetical protein
MSWAHVVLAAASSPNTTREADQVVPMISDPCCPEQVGSLPPGERPPVAATASWHQLPTPTRPSPQDKLHVSHAYNHHHVTHSTIATT